MTVGEIVRIRRGLVRSLACSARAIRESPLWRRGFIRCGCNVGYPGLSCFEAVMKRIAANFLHFLQDAGSIQKNQLSYCTILIDEQGLVCYIIVSMRRPWRGIELIRERKMFLWIAK